MKQPIISVSGLRGIIGESLSPELAMRYVAAFAALIPSGPIVLTRDGRSSGRMLADAIRSALVATGRNVIDADVAATPTTGVLVRHLAAAGGIQITASHNPAPYNGLKLFGSDGQVLSAETGAEVRQKYLNDSTAWARWDQIGRVSEVVQAADPHLHAILATVDVQRIRARKFKVLLDANHGSGSQLGLALLEELGCDAQVLGEVPDGNFDHEPEPTAENLQSVLAQVVATGADIGFCQDPDADRLAIIDERGAYLGEEYTLALCVEHRLRQEVGPIVTNCSTSRMAEDLAQRYGAPFYRSAVGEANVVAVMHEHEALLGGEGNGGVIDPRVGLVRDSFVAMALVLDALAERQLAISALAAELPRYAIVKLKAELSVEELPAALERLTSHFADARPERLDGLRLDWPNAWLLVRGSNTEPIVRIFAEAPTEAEAARLAESARGVLLGE